MGRLLLVASFVFLAACERPQSPICQQYEECLDISCPTCISVGERELFDPGGDCWTTTDEAAGNCERACRQALFDACIEYSDPICCEEKEGLYSAG